MSTEKTDGRRASLRAVMPVATTNAGLWLDRFPNRGDGKAPVRDLIVNALNVIKAPDGYPGAFARREKLLKSFDGGFDGGVTRFWRGKVEGRMIVGIGAASVRETGISLLRVWGLPFIPGSALKGVAAAMARKRAGDEWKPESAGYRTLFGDSLVGGCVVFHDAWWLPAVSGDPLPLDLDVMTVHHGDYYGGGKEAPCDWDEPNPVAFITARGHYLVALSGPASWVEATASLLTSALSDLGVGAKSAAGYGRVRLVRRLTTEEEEQARMKQDREEEQVRLNRDRTRKAGLLLALAIQFNGASNANDVVRKLLKAQREGGHPEDVRAAAVKLWRQDPSFWKQWLKKPSRSVEECKLIGSHLAYDAEKAPG